MKRDLLFHSFFLALFLFLLLQFARLLSPFLTPILGAVVLLILAHPLHSRLCRWIPRRSPGFHAALSTIVVTALMVGPLIAFSWFLLNESQEMASTLQQWGRTVESWRHGTTLMSLPWMRFIETRWRLWFGAGRLDFERFVLEWGSQLFAFVGGLGRALATNTILAIGYLALLIFTLFFLFKDGDSLFVQIKRLIPMRARDKDRLVEKLRQIVVELVRGSILTGICQTICAALGYLIAGVPGPVSLGVLTGVASFIPVVGTALIWLPMGLFLLAQASYGRGIFVLLWGALVISLLDNLLRTFFIGRRTSLPVLFLFFGIVGGAKLYGVKGVLIGPVLVAVIPVFVDIYLNQYLRKETPEPIGESEDVG